MKVTIEHNQEIVTFASTASIDDMRAYDIAGELTIYFERGLRALLPAYMHGKNIRVREDEEPGQTASVTGRWAASPSPRSIPPIGYAINPHYVNSLIASSPDGPTPTTFNTSNNEGSIEEIF